MAQCPPPLKYAPAHNVEQTLQQKIVALLHQREFLVKVIINEEVITESDNL